MSRILRINDQKPNPPLGAPLPSATSKRNFPSSHCTTKPWTQSTIQPFIEMSVAKHIPSGCKSPFLIGKPSINGPFSMAMLNNQRVITK